MHPVIYEDSYVRVALEVTANKSFIHCKSYKWNHNIYKHYRNVFSIILQDYTNKTSRPLGAAILPDDSKLQKFAKLFGFRKTADAYLGTDGNLRDIFEMGDTSWKR